MLATQIQHDHDAASEVFTRALDSLRRAGERLIEQRDQTFRALAFEGAGIQRLGALAQVTGLPFTAVYDRTSTGWKVTYGVGSSQRAGLGMTLDEAARAAYDRAAAVDAIGPAPTGSLETRLP